MFRLLISGLKRRKLRIFLLALAIIISIGFLVAIIVLSASIGAEVENADGETEINIAVFIRSFRYVFYAFNILGLLASIFVIAVTFMVILAQRSKELAMLRIIGASKSSVFKLVAWEAFLVGALGGIIGVASGLALAAGVLALGLQLDWGFENVDLIIKWHIFVWPVILSIFIVMISAILPAILASRRAPLQVLTSNELLIKNKYKKSFIVGCIFLILGLLIALPALLIDLDPEALQGSAPPFEFIIRLISLFASMVVVFVAFVILSPSLAKWSAKAFMGVLKNPRLLSLRFSASNIWRQPLRAALIASVVMFGIVLVTFFTVILGSFRATTVHFVEQFLPYNWEVAAPYDEEAFIPDLSQEVRVPPDLFTELSNFHEDVLVYGQRETRGVAEFAGETQRDDFDEKDESYQIVGFDMDMDLLEKLPLGIDETEFKNYEQGQLLVADYLIGSRGLEVGSEVVLSTDSGKTRQSFIVGGGLANFGGIQFLMDNQSYLALTGIESYDGVIIVNASKSSDKEVREDLEAILAPHDLQLFGRENIVVRINRFFDLALNSLRAFLSLVFLVATIGLFNILLLAIFERRREIGLLRAIGMPGGMLRRTISFEAIQIATLGAVLGTLLGIVFAWGFLDITVRDVLTAQPEQVEEGQPVWEFVFHVPIKELLIVYGAAVTLALTAAFIPALKATRAKIIDALKH